MGFPMLLSGLLSALLYNFAESGFIHEPQDTKSSPYPVRVSLHTPVSRQKRSLDLDHDSKWFDFPDKLSFKIYQDKELIELHLTKDVLYTTDIQITNAEGFEHHHFQDRFSMYHSDIPSAAVLVECHDRGCTMQGSVEIDGKLYNIAPDHDNTDLTMHFIKKKSMEELKKVVEFMETVKPRGDEHSRFKRSDPATNTEIARFSSSKVHSRSRRAYGQNSTNDLANCEIVEAKIVVDDSIWNEYMAKYNNDQTRATEEIWKYFTAMFGEVNLRMGNMELVLKASGCTAIKCMRVILVQIQFQKISSWTDGYTFTDGVQTFVKGYEALVSCSYLNQNDPNNNLWDMLFCFTRRNIAIYKDGAYFDKYRTYSWKPSMCNSNKFYSVSIQEAKGDGVDQQITHDIMHSFNANDASVTTCEDDNTVITKIFSDKQDIPTWMLSYYMSECTVREICAYVSWLNQENRNCLRQHSFTQQQWLDWYNATSVLPGTFITADEQCQAKYGPNCTACDPDGKPYTPLMCSRYMYCLVNNTCNCRIRVLDGTACGFARICLNGECIPIPNQPIGGICDCHSQCAGPHAECDFSNSTCRCASGFYDSNGSAAGGTCLPKVPINGSCSADDQCLDFHAHCQNNTCVCDNGYLEVNGTCECFTCPAGAAEVDLMCVGTTVGQPCSSALDTCSDNYAACNGSFCDCIQGFHWNGTQCVGSMLCDPCDSTPDSCASGLRCGITNRCECLSGQVQIGDACYGTRVGESCTTSPDTCADNNANCNGTVCNCVSGFYWNGTLCVGSSLCDPCQLSPDSCLPNFQCGDTTNRCECPAGKVQIGNNCYGTRVGESCTTIPDTCADNNANCNGTICNCIPGFYWNGTLCVGSSLCDPCQLSPDSCLPNFQCGDTTNRCECPADKVQIGNNCYGTRVGESCTASPDTCADNNANCNGTTCNCIPGFNWNGALCVGSSLCDPCQQIPDSCLPNFQCGNTTNRCECPDGKVQIGNNCYGTRVGDSCTTIPDTCADNNANCNGTICNCIPGFYWNGTLCVGSSLCDPCQLSPDSCLPNFQCGDTTNRCECPADKVQIGNNCYGTRVGESCTASPDTCADNNANCNGTTCNCIPGFNWNGALCVGSSLCDPCQQIPDSCLPNFQCGNTTNRCECPDGKVQIGNNCYGTRVGDSCTTIPDTCADNNANCNGTICNCIPGFYWNGTLCVGSSLCDPCQLSPDSCLPNFQCGDTTNRCECPADKVQIGNNCYGTRVGESCTASPDTCADNNANCNGTTCNCIPGFNWNGALCVGSSLCDPCQQIPDSCLPNFQCGNTTNRCECPDGKVQIGNNCYGTRVGDSCTTIPDTCADNNANCNGTICNCIPGFYWNGTLCVGSSLCDPCQQSPDSCLPNFQCGNTTNRCECPAGKVQIGNNCYGTRVGESCTTSLDTCADNNANCNGTICNCVSGFYWNGTLCVGSSLCDPCHQIPDSCLPNFQCGDTTNRCECPAGKVQIGNNCFSLLCGSCNSASNCYGNNTACVSNVCGCASGYYLGSCGTCQPKLSVNSSCLSKDQCTSGFCICGKCRSNGTSDCCLDCTDDIADIAIIMDSSTSVGNTDYQKEKQFVIDLVNAFTVSPTLAKIAVIDYSTSVHGYSFLLNTHTNNAGVVNAVSAFPYATGFTRTDLALYYAANPVFLAANGNRPGVKNFVIVITDGQSNNGANVPAASSFLKSNVTDLQVFSVGVTGGVNITELQTIATNNNNVFLAPTFDALTSIRDIILRAICT